MSLRSRGDDAQRRAILFGNTQRRPLAPPSSTSVAAYSEQESMETANLNSVDGLRGRVGEMRHLAIDLGDEVRNQNALLDGMHSTFDDAGGALGRTIREVQRLAANGGGSHMCLLFAFAFFCFLLVYLIFR